MSMDVFLVTDSVLSYFYNAYRYRKNEINYVWIRKTNYMSLFVFFISLLIVAQHVSGNHVPICRS